MERKILRREIEKGNFSNVYLFYGPENYLKSIYIKKIKSKLVANDFENFNFCKFDQDNITTDGLLDAVESLPLFADKKVVVVDGLNITKKLSQELSTEIEKILSDVPEYIVLIFNDSDVDKRSKLYKLIDKKDATVAFEYLTMGELSTFVIDEFQKRGKEISADCAQYLVLNSDNSMLQLINEIEKLAAYAFDSQKIEKRFIDTLITKPFELKLFDLSEAIVQKDTTKAHSILNELKLFKYQYPAIMLISLIARHFTGMYITFENRKNKIGDDVTINMLGGRLHSFVVNKYYTQAQKLGIDNLIKIIKLCSDNDVKVKSGLIDPYYVIEEIIAMNRV